MTATGTPWQRSKPTRAWRLVAALVLLASACTIPSNDSAQPLQDVPEDLLAATTTLVEPLPEQLDPSFTVRLYWHGPGPGFELGRVIRPVATTPTPQLVIDELLKGPTADENDSQIVPLLLDAALAAVTPSPVLEGPDAGGIVTVTFAGLTFRELADKRIATAELVCTLTDLDGISGVRMQDTQGELGLVDISTETIEGPASRANFNECSVVEPTPPSSPDATAADG